jgi:hypothetical protein
LPREGRQVGGDHDRGHVLGFEVVATRVGAEALQHADQAFAGEHGAVQIVARAVQPDHQAVSDQVVVAHALELGDVLDAGLSLGRGRPQRASKHDKAEQPERCFAGPAHVIVSSRYDSAHHHRLILMRLLLLCEERATLRVTRKPADYLGFRRPKPVTGGCWPTLPAGMARQDLPPREPFGSRRPRVFEAWEGCCS